MRRGLGSGLLVLALAATVPAAAAVPQARPASPIAVVAGSTVGQPEARDGAGWLITAQDFGIHSFSSRPETGSGSIRMNCWPAWKHIEHQDDAFRWSYFDSLVAKVESWGFTDITFVFCATPAWAAMAPQYTGPDHGEAFGDRSTHAPTLQAWDDVVRQVARRYKGRITGYEIWNEIANPQFWRGSVDQMADMTKHAFDIIRQEDPAARVLSAGMQTRYSWHRTWNKAYVRALKQRGWPIDVWSVHLYPTDNGSPSQLESLLASFTQTLADEGAPSRPIWNTETSFGTNGEYAGDQGRIAGDQAAAWTAWTYLDAWRINVSRTYWYVWAERYNNFTGIQTRRGDPATVALTRLAQWTIGARLQGCEETDAGVGICRFTRDAAPFSIVWTEADDWSEVPTATLYLPTDDPVERCRLLVRRCGTTTRSIVVTGLPQLIRERVEHPRLEVHELATEVSAGETIAVLASTSGLRPGMTARLRLDDRMVGRASVEDDGAIAFPGIVARWSGRLAVSVAGLTAERSLVVRDFGVSRGVVSADGVKLTISTGAWPAGTRIVVSRDGRRIRAAEVVDAGRPIVVTVPARPGTYSARVRRPGPDVTGPTTFTLSL